jgi:putative peptidoglycan lipid II flippase
VGANAGVSRLRRLVRPDTMVAAGILASRVSGLVRTTIFSIFFGLQNDAADAFNAAFRIPNLLQNLFGEGALSGSFIPIHSGLRAQGREAEAAQTARVVFALLMLVMSVLVLLGEIAAPFLTSTVAGGFVGEKRELTIQLVRILFPGAALLVSAAWCLGVLNSHGKFLLSYASGIAWNAGMIGALLIFGPRSGRDLDHLAVMLAWGSVVGSALQFAVQAPIAFSLSRGGGGLAFSEPVRRAIRDFTPVMISRGAVQISAYIDQYIASYLPKGAVTGLTNTAIIYTLPVSLFGISVSAAQLPALSRDAALADLDRLRQRINRGLDRLTFFVVPSALAFATVGDVIAGVILQHGRFHAADSRIIWGMLAGSAIGLVASTQSRLYSVAHYALGDTKKPLRFALIRIVLVGILGYLSARVLPPLLGVPEMWGAGGLTGSAGVAGWIEFALLRRSMAGKIGPTGVGASRLAILWGSALAGAAVGWAVKLAIPWTNPLVRGVLILPAFGVTYLACTALFGIDVRRQLRRD